MKKTILITGSTDGIGYETARMLVSKGHHVLLHGRNPEKLKKVEEMLSDLTNGGGVECFLADLSRLADANTLANQISQKHTQLDVLINNAGVFRAPNTITPDGLDIRFSVNTISPYLLTKRLIPVLGKGGRVINVSSAAQSPVNADALLGKLRLSDYEAYAQSKLALIMWSQHMALSLKDDGPVIVSINPGSLLGTKMVKDAFGMDGKDVRIGAEILTRGALSDEFQGASGKYFDNDSGRFATPHPDALDNRKCEEIAHIIETILNNKLKVSNI